MLRCPTNRVLLGAVEEANKLTFSEESVDYLWEIVNVRIANKSEADPIRIFVKPEPHKLKKLEQSRYRLISSVSVVDQIIDHMLFDDMNLTMIDNYPSLPSKVGWSVVKGGWRMIPKVVWMATDKSSWDWTVQPWLLELTLQLRKLLCQGSAHYQQWCDLADYRYQQLYQNPLFILSNGILLRQRRSGIQKSGCVNTIADNSLMQWLLHARICLEMKLPVAPMMATGDDVLQQPFPEFDAYLERMSQFCNIKEAVLMNEFAGMRFGKTIEPSYFGKHAFNLLHLDPEVAADVALSYPILYHRSYKRDWIRKLFTQMGLEIFPLKVVDIIYDGYESYR